MTGLSLTEAGALSGRRSCLPQVYRALLAGCLIAPMAAAVPAMAAPSPKTKPAAAASSRPVKGQSLVLPTHAQKPDLKEIAKEQCFRIREIAISGLELIEPNELRPLVQPLAYHCLGNGLAKAVIAAINNAHAARGFVTTQGYVPQQDVKGSQRLAIQVVTGRIGKVIMRERNADQSFQDGLKQVKEAQGPWGLVQGLSTMLDSLDNRLDRFQLLSAKAFPELKAWLAMPAAPGEALQLDEVQQGLDQLNRASSQKAAAKLEPGAEPGTSNVVIAMPRADSFRLTAGYEINGSNLNGPGTTPQRARFDLAKDNLIGLNDNWAATFASGLDSNEVRSSLVVPVRWLTLALNTGYNENFTALSDYAGLYTRKWTAGLTGSYVLARDRTQLTTLEAGLNYRDNMRWINDIRLLPQLVSFTRIGISQTRYLDNGQLVYGIGVSRGLPFFGATDDRPDAPASAPRARFWKLDAALHYQQALKEWGAVRLDVSGQYAPRPLYQDDQLTLGSSSSVRGFARAPAFADTGVLVRGEFAPKLPIDGLFGEKAKDWAFAYDGTRGLQPYVFADLGYGRDLANRHNVSRIAAGAGLRYSFNRLSLDWTLARPLDWEHGYSGRRINKLETYLNLNIKLF